jgi:hypothetical protein
MASPAGTFEWDILRISLALNLDPDDARRYFTDGRRVSFLLERRIAYEVLSGKLAPSEGAGYDVLDRDGGKWEIRSISKQGIYFCPSYMVGSKRRFDENGFLKKLREIEGYVVSDIEEFPRVPYWIIAETTVKDWYYAGRLGKSTNISRKKALNLLMSM